MNDLSYQLMPWRLREALMVNAISLEEARLLHDLMLLQPAGWILPPEHLLPAVRRLNLLQLKASPVVH